MSNPTGSRIYASILAFVVAAGAYLASPDAPQAAASSCSGLNSGKVCWQNESCVDILFYKQCTTTYKYFPAANERTGGGGCRWDPEYPDSCSRYAQ